MSKLWKYGYISFAYGFDKHMATCLFGGGDGVLCMMCDFIGIAQGSVT